MLKPYIVALILLLAWLTDATTAKGQVIAVPMNDGTELATEVYLPSGAGPWPVLLYRTPYDRSELTNLAPTFTAPPFEIALVVQSVRGRFGSQGSDGVFTTDGAAPGLKDGYDTCDWIVKQSWCNGKIAWSGASANGIVQYMAAPTGPPGAVFMSPTVATPTVYEHFIFWSGVYRHEAIDTWLTDQGSTHFLTEIAAHPYEDDFWKWVQTSDQFSAVTVPALHTGGWYDIFAQGTIDAFRGYQHHGAQGAAGMQKLVMGPWTHGATFQKMQGELTYPDDAVAPPAGDLFVTLLSHYLGLATADPDGIPNVQYYVMGAVDEPGAPGNDWRTADDFPPAAAPVRLHLHADGSLAETCPSETASTTSYLYDPVNPSPTVGGTNLNIAWGPHDQQAVEQRTDVVVFSTPVLSAPVEITGRVKAHIFVDIDQPDTDLMVRMTDVYPDGRSMLIADGAHRLASRGTTTGITTLSVGEIVEAVVDLWSTSIIINTGHRLRISVSSSNYPRFAANLNNGKDFPANTWDYGNQAEAKAVTVNLHHSAAYASYLEIPDPNRTPTDFQSCSHTGGAGGAGGAAGTAGSGSGASSGVGDSSGAEPSDENAGCSYRHTKPPPTAYLALCFALGLLGLRKVKLWG